MWDRPELLDRTATLLVGAAAALAIYGAGTAALQLPRFALREVRLVHAVPHVTAAQVAAVVKDLRGNFFTIDLESARAAFERVPWVRRVEVRRQWPGRLDVVLEEHVPLARWGEGALVNVQGEIFEGEHHGLLPVFHGPADSSREITAQYDYFRRSLAAIDQIPAQVRVSPRRAWQVTLANGITLELGRANIEARLTRFVAAYGRTVGQLDRRLDYVDLRYPNGFAVRIPGLRPVTKKRGSG
jgi:cell division protein FtsQ